MTKSSTEINEKSISTIMKEMQVTYKEATVIQENSRLKREAIKEACILAEMRKDRTPLFNMKKRAEKAELDYSIIKGIDRNEVKEKEKYIDRLLEEIEVLKKNYTLLKEDQQANNLAHVNQLDLKQKELDRSNKEKNDLFIRIRDLEEDKIKKLRLSGL